MRREVVEFRVVYAVRLRLSLCGLLGTVYEVAIAYRNATLSSWLPLFGEVVHIRGVGDAVASSVKA